MKAGWDEKKLGDVITLEYGKPLPENRRKPDGKYPVYGANGILCRSDDFYYDEKSLIVGRKGSAGEITYSENKFWALDVTYFTKFNSDIIDLDYLYYQLKLLNLPKLAKGVKPGINRNEVYDISISLPPLSEQKKIADSLDKKCSAIDTSIQKEHEIIDKFKEYRQSVITEAVTKGINKNAKMKESGVEWIGDIPENWDIVKIKTYVETTKGFAFKPIDFVDSGIPVVKSTDIKNETVLSGNTYINKNYLQEYNKVKLYPNDILLTTVGSNPEIINSAVGQIARVPKDIKESLLNQNVVRIKSHGSLLQDYLFDCIRMHAFRKYLDLISHGTANQSSISLSDILDYNIPLPKISEQKQIVSYLDKKCSDIDTVISEKQKLIDKLEEYKKSLIYEYVTGKKVVT